MPPRSRSGFDAASYSTALIADLTPYQAPDAEDAQRAGTPLSFREFVSKVKPRFRWYRHCEALASVLQRVADGELGRVMVFEPPRHGKSEEVSRLFSAYYLHRHPDRFVGLNSYSAELAYTLSRASRENYVASGGVLKSSASAVKHWETPKGGGLWAAGVGGAITGKGFHVGIIDDPIKNAEEAASDKIRAKQKEWYSSTFYTREEPDGAIIVVQTRWHADDLSGWLLAQELEEDPECWHVVNLAALAEGERQFPASCTVEPDWREPGQALCPERYPPEKLKKIERRIGDYFFGALFQQRPTAKEGAFFKVGKLDVVDLAPAGLKRCRAWDLAASKDGDYSAGVLLGLAEDGLIYVLDVERGRWLTDERNNAIRASAWADGDQVKVRLPQDPGQAGVDQAKALSRLLAGFPVKVERVTGSKESRADPFAAQLNVGNVRLVRGPWNRAFVEELRQFPLGAQDDQVDAAADAFTELCGKPRWTFS